LFYVDCGKRDGNMAQRKRGHEWLEGDRGSETGPLIAWGISSFRTSPVFYDEDDVLGWGLMG